MSTCVYVLLCFMHLFGRNKLYKLYDRKCFAHAHTHAHTHTHTGRKYGATYSSVNGTNTVLDSIVEMIATISHILFKLQYLP